MQIQEKIKKWIGETLKIEDDLPAQAGFVLAHPKDIKNGDYSFFAAGNANEFGRILSENKIPEIEEVKVAGGFINFYLSENFFAESIKEILDKGENCGKNNLLDKEKTIIEYTDPNPFKQFHIGHLMSNTIGEAISRISEANGAEIKRANYQGDVGIHIAYAIWGIENKGGILNEGSTEEKTKYLGECYSLGATTLKENENLKSEFQDINKKVYEKSDEKLNKFYEWGRKVSLDYFEMMYERLGTKFDFYFFESEVGDEGKKVVLEFLKKGIFEESDGAIVFRGEKYDKKLHTRVFINSQGLPVYEAKELALAKIKSERYKYDKSIVITGNEINDYFKVLLAAMKEIFPDLAAKTKHLSHGMLRLPTGKMASRTGDVITAEDLIDQVKEKVQEKIDASKHVLLRVKMTAKEEEKMIEQVAIGAIKYSILRQAIGGDIIFDFDKSISFDGDSGPYLQYAHTRAKSVLEKSETQISDIKTEKPKDWETTDLEKHLYRFLEVVERASREYAPHHIVTYLTELASIFNGFYAREKIIDEDDPSSPYKVALTAAVAYILKSGLNLLGIKAPDRM